MKGSLHSATLPREDAGRGPLEGLGGRTGGWWLLKPSVAWVGSVDGWGALGRAVAQLTSWLRCCATQRLIRGERFERLTYPHLFRVSPPWPRCTAARHGHGGVRFPVQPMFYARSPQFKLLVEVLFALGSLG